MQEDKELLQEQLRRAGIASKEAALKHEHEVPSFPPFLSLSLLSLSLLSLSLLSLSLLSLSLLSLSLLSLPSFTPALSFKHVREEDCNTLQHTATHGSARPQEAHHHSITPTYLNARVQCQKIPITVSKEAYYSVKRGLLQCQKRPIAVSKETLHQLTFTHVYTKTH